MARFAALYDDRSMRVCCDSLNQDRAARFTPVRMPRLLGFSVFVHEEGLTR
ncbi:MAG: hypothetical protein ABIP90_05970 [Vicinamibacterales bacterium]